MYPNKNFLTQISKNGVYGVRMRFNGTQRIVLIDEKLPFNSKSEPIFTQHNGELITQFLEKATVKIYGSSYNTIFSNPSIEMHHFIGWIPETVRFNDVNNKENLWSRMKQNFTEGNIILSINAVSEEEEAKIVVCDSDLTPEDSPLLAVLDIREFKDHKLVK